MPRGRKRKTGNREKNGRPSRAGTSRLDRGTEYTQAMQALYGQDGADAIGRAYRAGLLGEGSDAKAMLDTARRISSAYWSAYAVGTITCTLGDRHGGGLRQNSSEKVKEREDWLAGVLGRVNAIGRSERRYFDQMVVEVHPDHGPAFLDRLLFASRCKSMMAEPNDLAMFDQALTALALVAGVTKPDIQCRVST